MNNWLIFFLGVLIGWAIELLIDYLFWRPKLQQAYSDCENLQARIDTLEKENQRLRQEMRDLEAQAQEVDTRGATIPLQDESVSPDDLRKIEGIGVKIAQILNAAGIYTFAQLADVEIAQLHIILEEAGPRFRLADPSTWPEQAALAARGAWDELHTLQDSLKGGRK